MNVESGSEFLFWGTLVLVAYIYLGYPLVAVLRARLRPRRPIRAPIEPSVSIVVVAHNEAEQIAARIENLLALDYPPDRRELVVVSDGSTDATVDRARRYDGAGVTVRACATRRGKSAVLNTVVPDLHSAPGRSRVFSVPCAVCLLSWATVVGFIRFLTHRQQATWDRVASPTLS